jgi:2-keto-4-pentenoate hydratase/2-oxohepta-3-ene-1,7-dioic acid hydratase in catechol pathway
MKYLTFASKQDMRDPCLGVAIKNTIVDLDELRTWAQGARFIPREDLPESMIGLIFSGSDAWKYVDKLVGALEGEDPLTLKGAHRKPVGYTTDEVIIYPPLPNPESMRDFFAFEQYVKNVYAVWEKDMPSEWYDFPTFYYSNPHAMYGPGSVIPHPQNSQEMDFELEVACVIGKTGRDIPIDQAQDYIFGFTILNDWSARDILRKEMRIGLGPAKSKDFASSIGPWIVTPDELEKQATDRPGVYDLEMIARLNGEEKSRGNWRDIHYSFAEMIAHASRDVFLVPGDLIGSGTVGKGSLLDITSGMGPWLKPGDLVELEIEGLGVLSNQVGAVSSPSSEDSRT